MSFTYRQQVEAELAKSPGLVAVLEGYVEGGIAGARNAAPVGRTHHYAESIDGAVAADRRGLVGVVFSTDFAAHLVEFGSINNPPYAPLRRGVESTGLRVTDRGPRDSG